MSEATEILNSVLQRRGYLVMGTHGYQEPGDVVSSVTAWGETINQKMVVLSPTTEQDFVEQMLMSGRPEPKPDIGGWTYYYRVTCE